MGMTFPLTDSQMLFWKGHLLHPNKPLYNMAWRFDLHFDLQPDLFRAAFAETLRQNEILRSAVRDTPDGPRQYALDETGDLLDVRDLSSDTQPENRLASDLPSWVQTAFDLSSGTLRSQLVKLAETHWVWLVCQHHIACDAQSGALLFAQVSQRYSNLEQTGNNNAEALPGFFHSSVLQAPSRSKTTVAAPKSSAPPYGSNPKRASDSKRFPITVEPEVFTALENAITQQEFRLFTPELSRLAIYLTAYFAYLHRVTGDERITIGLPSHNRLTQEDRNTIGPFVEVLPFSVGIEDTDTLRTLYDKIKTGLGTFLKSARPGAVSHVDTSGISAVCNYIQARFGGFAGRPATVEWLHSGAHDAMHALRLHIMDFEGSARPKLFLDVQNEVLDSVSEEDMSTHFLRCLKAVLSDLHTRISTVGLSGDVRDKAIIQGPLETPSPFGSVLDAFVAQVEKDPHLVALSCADEVMSYDKLHQRSDQIAAHLSGLGIPKASCIAVHLPRSFDFMAAVLGILKAGCCFVPIASNLPKARALEILQGCRAAAVFVAHENTGTYPCPSISAAETLNPAKIDFSIRPQDTAYVLFTSGSTGIPKGVEVSHKNLARYINWAAYTFAGSNPAHFAFFSSVSFDLTLTSMFVPLITGGSVRIYPERSDPDLAVLDVFADDAVDIVKLTPSHLALACKQGQPLTRIQTLVLGGENLTSQLCRKARDVLSPNLEIINEYGPTEAVVGAMHHAYDPRADAGPSVQIGQPASGMSISIRDTALNVCPLGIPGEIVIGGRLAQGYFGNPSLSAEKFMDDPLNLQGRVYRTGDLGRMTNDGKVEYLGRSDQQIKKNGVRLETAEYDRVLRRLSGVEAVHVAFSSVQPDTQPSHQCIRCGLTNTVPGVRFEENNICTICAEFDDYKDRAGAYFQTEPELERRIVDAAKSRRGPYDAVMMLSGGKDSTYAAYRLAAHTHRVLAVTLDNGYISKEAKDNIQRVVSDLNWDHRYLSTDKMNQIFVDSLKTHSNVCQGCFKALYTLAFRTALTEGAPIVVTGLSRGQFFETRLTPELFRHAAPTCGQLDDLVTKARKAYHAEDDEVARLLETDDLKDGRFLSEVEVLDIYRYIDVPVSEIYDFLETRTAWKRPSDTGRSTNCLINDAGIHVHKAREGFHNYALPYSWDVRMGHKTREQALEELNDEIDTGRVQAILEEIGFDEPVARAPKLTVYVAGHGLVEPNIWDTLRESLPREMLPDQIVILENMPINGNGKVDTSRLPAGSWRSQPQEAHVAPETETQRRLASILKNVLGVAEISATREFFDLGVDSITAIEIAMRANEMGLNLPTTALFEHRTLRALADYADTLPAEQTNADDHTPLVDLDDDELFRITEALD